MKTSIILCLTLIVITIGCKKDQEIITRNIYHPIAGDVYISCIQQCYGTFNSSFIVSDSNYNYNKQSALFYYHQPSLKQDCFIIDLYDTTTSINKHSIQFDLFVPSLQPKDFFKSGTINIDTLAVNYSNSSENIGDYFYNVNSTIKWDTASFDSISRTFKGKGTFSLLTKLRSKIDTTIFYPPQDIKFEFK